jgi:hypothetical protein
MSFIHAVRAVVVGCAVTVAVGCAGTIEAVDADQDFDALATTEENLSRAVDASKELLITDLSVIESAEETTFDSTHPSGVSKRGAWSFGRLVHNMLPKANRGSAGAASNFAYSWLGPGAGNQQPNASVLSVSGARSRVRDFVIEPWKTASGCTAGAADADCVLDMGKAPFRLVAIVYRPDLRKLATETNPGHAGEGRFVFNLLVDGKPVKETVIFEYSLPISTNLEVLTWAYRWHLLGSFPFGSTYNALLRTITNGFSGPDADRRRPNGNAINQLRTNELVLKHVAGCASPAVPPALCPPAESTAAPTQKLWELREFHLTTSGLVQAPMAQEPSRDFDTVERKDGTRVIGTGLRSNELAKWMLDNSADILANKHTVPSAWLANSSYVGSGVSAWGATTGFKYTAPDATVTPVPEAVRSAFALQTCAGCHRHEANAATGASTTPTFLHITDPRAFDPSEANDQAAIAAAAGARNTVVSDFLAKEIAVGGPRYNDLVGLLHVKPWDLKGFAGLTVCHGEHD